MTQDSSKSTAAGDATFLLGGGEMGALMRASDWTHTPVGPPESWEHHGLTGDAKGQPVQSNHPSHGSAPCLIRKIMVGAAYA